MRKFHLFLCASLLFASQGLYATVDTNCYAPENWSPQGDASTMVCGMSYITCNVDAIKVTLGIQPPGESYIGATTVTTPSQQDVGAQACASVYKANAK